MKEKRVHKNIFANKCSKPITDALEKGTHPKSEIKTPILRNLHNNTGVFLTNTK